MKRYFDHTTDEKLTLSHEDFVASVKVEAIHRGIKPPVTLPEILKQSEWSGFQIDPDSLPLYQVVIPKSYGGVQETGLCFKTQEEAENAIRGCITLQEEGYGATAKTKIITGEVTVMVKRVTLTQPKSFTVPLEEYYQDDTEYEKLCQECSANLAELRQSKYDAEVLAHKRSVYLELAKGDEEIAKAFWEKTERTSFPVLNAA